MAYKYDVERDCELLSQQKTFANLYKLICAHGSIPAAVWLEGEKEKFLSFNQQAYICDAWALEFQARFGTTGRIAISLDSCKEWFPLFWGLVRSGHDVLLLDASMADEKAAVLMSQAGCKGIVSARLHDISPDYVQVLVSDIVVQTAQVLESLPDELDSLARLDYLAAREEGDEAPVARELNYVPIWGHDVALCTSGTTSDSRLFIYDEETLCELACFSSAVFRKNHLLIDNVAFRTLAFLPFHHVLGFAGIFIWSHFLGYSTVYLKDRSPVTITRTSQKCRVSQIVAVPLLANSLSRSLMAEVNKRGIAERSLFKAQLNISLAVQSVFPRRGLRMASHMFYGTRKKLFGNEIRSIVLGGSHTDASSLKLLNALGYYTICGYGMTETAITSFETSMRLDNRTLGSIGQPLGGTEYRLRPLGTEKGGKPGKTGELQIRGKGLHDARIVDGQRLPADLDEDGWFSTGDIVRMVDSPHQIFVEGRLKEVIINESGENVYPDELEDRFIHIPGMKQYAIVGLSRKQSHYEDIAFLASVGEMIDDKAFLDKLAREIRVANKELPVYSRLTKALVTGESLPVANGFKVKRIAVKKAIESGILPTKELSLSPRKDDEVAPEGKAPSQERDRQTEELFMMVRGIFSQVLSVPADSINPDANFIEDLGGDSLQILSIITRAEDSFGVMIPTESYQSCATVNGAVTVLSGLLYGTGDDSRRRQLTVRKPITDFEASPEYIHFRERREALLGSGARDPYFVVHDSPLLDTSVVGGRSYLDFGSYNYVGMSGRKEVNDAAKAAIDRWGTSASGSRLLAGEKPVHAQLEKAIAEWKNAEAALVLVGGHSTNVTVVGNFCGSNDLILYDALAHNSIEQGCRLSEATAKPFPHNDLQALEQILKAQRKYFEKVLIVIEGVYSMDGDVSDVPGFIRIKKQYGCFLMVDEAHSSCVLGAAGGGVDEYFHLASDDIDIKYGTLSKGLGTCGGYIAGRKALVDYFRYNLPGFVFSVGISPALAAGSLEAIRQLRSNPAIMESLHANIRCFVEEAKKRHLDICLAGESAILPVLVGKDEDAVALSNELEDRGILVPPAVHPAVPKNKARLRFDVISEHKPEQIVFALDTLVQAAKDLGIELPLKEW